MSKCLFTSEEATKACKVYGYQIYLSDEMFHLVKSFVDSNSREFRQEIYNKLISFKDTYDSENLDVAEDILNKMQSSIINMTSTVEKESPQQNEVDTNNNNDNNTQSRISRWFNDPYFEKNGYNRYLVGFLKAHKIMTILVLIGCLLGGLVISCVDLLEVGIPLFILSPLIAICYYYPALLVFELINNVSKIVNRLLDKDKE